MPRTVDRATSYVCYCNARPSNTTPRLRPETTSLGERLGVVRHPLQRGAVAVLSVPVAHEHRHGDAELPLDPLPIARGVEVVQRVVMDAASVPGERLPAGGQPRAPADRLDALKQPDHDLDHPSAVFPERVVGGSGELAERGRLEHEP